MFSATTVGGPFTITATVGSVSGSTGVTVTGGMTYAAWQSAFFTSTELGSVGVSGPNAAPAGDGITNLMKCALNLNPKSNGVSGLPTASAISPGGQSYLAFTYTQVPSITDITYTVEVSLDLQTWSSGAGSTIVVSTINNPDGKTQTVIARDLTPESSTAKRFMRLKITMP